MVRLIFRDLSFLSTTYYYLFQLAFLEYLVNKHNRLFFHFDLSMLVCVKILGIFSF